ncbi:FecR family protein [Flavivirga aquimarina]|uniref:FecR family protein n=1 Tax=Flavivirga aquimarina TaxID=2027862 RepID=A0ABT8W564_9FLAO|nr:FecR family protein [Flavivirga aquimarina]MDO5968254.1 FecR family protein [Flavivirga aquimarina]
MKINSQLLEKYVNGKCSKEEIAVIELWLENNKDIPNVLSEEELQFESDLMWGDISKNIKPSKQKKKAYKKLISYASVACVALFIGLITFQFFLKTPFTTYETLVGETKRIQLDDGSVIHMNASSVLLVSKEFSKKNREVSLNGEAYFEIAKDSLHPFTITTKESKTTVLGTKFSLSAYPNERTYLTLNEGKVSFKSLEEPTNSKIVLPNQQVILSENYSITKKDVNANFYNSWTKNELFFNESLRNVFKDIERKYNVKIQVNNKSVLNQVYKGYHKSPTLENLLKKIGFVMKLKYKKNGDTIMIY